MDLQTHIKIPGVLKKMHGIFSAAGFEAYLVGGAVRDMLMGKTPHDYDVATNARPEIVTRLFRKVIPTGIAHGTVTVLMFGQKIEVTTFRTESDYADSRHPNKISYAATIEDDLSRRDFTMNAIAVNLADGKIVDPYNGSGDIRQRKIKTVGSAKERFAEDGLRPVRAVRFSAQLNFDIEAKTLDELSENSTHISTAKISIERFRDEFVKMLGTEKPSVALRLLEKTGLMQIFLPELLETRGCVQADARSFHKFDVADHIFTACDFAPKENISVRLAALFHDIGKPACKTVAQTNAGEIYHFYRHEKTGEKKTRDILTRLKFPNATIDDVCHLVAEHMFHYESSWSDAAVRRFIVRAGENSLENLYALRLADEAGKHGVMPDQNSDTATNIAQLKKRVEQELGQGSALCLKDLAVNGKDLMDEGIPPGKQMGQILHKLFEAVIDDPAKNDKATLVALAKEMAK